MAKYRLLALWLAAGSVLLETPAQGRNWPSAGGWDIIEGEEYCAITSEFEGPGDTELHLILRLDGSVILGVSNSGWSIEDEEEIDLSYALNGKSYGGGKAFGMRPDSKPGFVSGFDPVFVEDFIKSTYLHIYRGATVVDKLDLAGSAAAIAQARRCLAHVKSLKEAEQRERARWAGIPTDPFAGTAKTFGPSEPKANLGSYISGDDYPPSALRAGESGTTEYRLDVGPDGRATNCTVTSSSGSTALDQATCRLLIRRARFTPARDPSGNPTQSSVTGSHAWKLPT